VGLQRSVRERIRHNWCHPSPSVCLSGCPIREIWLTFLFKGLIIGKCSYVWRTWLAKPGVGPQGWVRERSSGVNGYTVNDLFTYLTCFLGIPFLHLCGHVCTVWDTPTTMWLYTHHSCWCGGYTRTQVSLWRLQFLTLTSFGLPPWVTSPRWPSGCPFW
jgi:hypothetical protein